MSFFRLWTLFFSLFVHGSMAALLLVFSDDALKENEQVYRVALAEFMEPQRAEVLGQAEETAPLPPEVAKPVIPEPPAPIKPVPQKKTEAVKPVEPKTISPRKTEAPPRQETSPASPRPAASPPALSSSPQTQQVGGFAAYKSDQVDQRPSISRSATPEYPNKARRMGIEGKVMVQVVVNTEGMAKACTVLSADPAGYFEEAALKAAERMRFIPGSMKGRPVNTLVRLPFVFSLR